VRENERERVREREGETERVREREGYGMIGIERGRRWSVCEGERERSPVARYTKLPHSIAHYH
jgi:hypothetical protein